MAVGLSATLANAMLQLLDTTYEWIQFHVGDPGAAGTANIAAMSTRQQVEWSAAAGGVISIDADIVVTNVPASEDWTHFSVWSASSGGTFAVSGTVTANPVVATDNVTIDNTSVTVTFPLAS